MTQQDSLTPSARTVEAHQDLVARVALACAGLSGNAMIGDLVQVYGATAVAAAAFDDPTPDGPVLATWHADRIRHHAGPATVARVLEKGAQSGAVILTPQHRDWPAQLNALGVTAPLLLWTHGDTTLLSEAAIAVTGATDPSPTARRVALEVATGLADVGWPVASTTRRGVDQLALDGATAMKGATIVVNHCAPPTSISDRGHRTVSVTENPPLVAAGPGCAQRAQIVLAALASRLVVVGASSTAGAGQVALASHAFSRPTGIVATEEDDDVDGLARRHGVRVVRSVTDIERLH